MCSFGAGSDGQSDVHPECFSLPVMAWDCFSKRLKIDQEGFYGSAVLLRSQVESALFSRKNLKQKNLRLWGKKKTKTLSKMTFPFVHE